MCVSLISAILSEKNKERLAFQAICSIGLLSMRQQFFPISRFKSESKTITSGVPQGSILDPKLFLIFVNDLAESLTNRELYLFADDRTIFNFGENNNDIV